MSSVYGTFPYSITDAKIGLFYTISKLCQKCDRNVTWVERTVENPLSFDPFCRF